VKLLEGDRSEPTPPEQAATPPTESDNPIGALQEYCQSKALTMPIYELDDATEGFCCTVWAFGLTANATASVKKKAKTEAAVLLLEALARVKVYRV
jgi:dsRNA-specific ribonuclease